MNTKDAMDSLDAPQIDEEIIRSIRFRDTKVILGLASWCGWEMLDIKQFMFIAHDGTKLRLPTNTNLNMKVFRSKVRSIFRHRDPDAYGNPPLGVIVGHVIDQFKVDASHAHMLHQLADEAQSRSQPESVLPAIESGGSVESEPAPVETETVRERYITKHEPWSAHRSLRKGAVETYPSQAVTERTWSDGVTDYACQWEGCPYTHEIPQSVARHFAGHRRGQGKAEQMEADGIDPDWTPRRRAKIQRLRGEIDNALTAAFASGIDWSTTDQAEWIATWIIDHRIDPVSEGGEASEARELTTEEVLDKIAALVDRGRGKILREQIDSLNSAVEGYMAEVDDARNMAAAAMARAERAEGNLHALRDLINETDKEETGE